VTATGNLHLLFPPIGLRLKLDRTVDRLRPCHDNIAVIDRGCAVHSAGLRCCQCGRHRGWLPRQGFEFLSNITQRFGAPVEPIILRDRSIGDHTMTEKKYDNSGILFKNEDKNKDTDRDYRGSATIDGREFWVSGWIREAKNGAKFLKCSFKAKDAATAKPKPTPDNNMSDEVPF
jgi:hypothetical protein